MALTINQYLTPYNYNTGTIDRIKYIVIHYVGATGGAYANCQYYASQYLGASAHYFVGFDGEIWQSVEDKNIAWHCGASSYVHPECRNSNSLGIEMCVRNKGSQSSTSKDWYFEDATVKTAIELTKELMAKYNIDADHVIRHYDVTGKICLPTDSTELLTKNGWISLKEVSIGDEIATYNTDSDEIIFDNVLDVVEPYSAETLKCRGLEATANHTMYAKPNAKNSHCFRDMTYEEMLQGSRQYIVKTGAQYHGKGLDLTDDEIRLLVWVQGDGHYNFVKGTAYSVEFHFKKDRKVTRLKELLERMSLGFSYSYGTRKDGTYTICINSKEFYAWCEEWLDGKKFGYNLLEMTERQFGVFWEELMEVDGCKQSELYSSIVEQNLDVVQALCALNGMRSNKCKLGTEKLSAIVYTQSNYSIGGKNKKVYTRQAEVSCVTVNTGHILIRQDGKTFIVGNCGNPYVYNNTNHTWDEFKAGITTTLKEGWRQNDVGWWYENADGTWPADCWKLIDHYWYYFNAEGYMLKGWQYINGEWYYLEGNNEEHLEGACWHEKGNGALERWYVE